MKSSADSGSDGGFVVAKAHVAGPLLEEGRFRDRLAAQHVPPLQLPAAEDRVAAPDFLPPGGVQDLQALCSPGLVRRSEVPRVHGGFRDVDRVLAAFHALI